jgi:hypothetical protein
MKTLITGERCLAEPGVPHPGLADSDPARKLEVNVILTTEQGTLAALKTARELAIELGARINLIAAQAVPWALPLTRPQVPVQCIEQRLLDLIWRGADGSIETNVQVYLCRDKQQALLKALRPNSLVVMGGKMDWWPSEATRTAKILERKGHHVVFAVPR